MHVITFSICTIQYLVYTQKRVTIEGYNSYNLHVHRYNCYLFTCLQFVQPSSKKVWDCLRALSQNCYLTLLVRSNPSFMYKAQKHIRGGGGGGGGMNQINFKACQILTSTLKLNVAVSSMIVAALSDII